jgi:hypothetical protein
MEENKVYEAYMDLPDGYQVHLMVLKDYPGGRSGRRKAMSVFRSRVWIGHETESEPMLHRSQEHGESRVAVDACYSLLLSASLWVVDSPDALSVIRQWVHDYFRGQERLVV